MTRTVSPTLDRPEQPNISHWAGCVLSILSVIVLAGYAFNLTALERFVPASVEMKANSAVAIMLAGIALLRRRHPDSFLYSISVSSVGALTLCEYLCKRDFGIDELLFRDAHYVLYPGRMSQYTSVGCVMLGASLLLMNSRHQLARRLSRVLGSLTGVLGAIAIASHAYNTHAASLIQPHRYVSIPTALGFLIAAIGVQYANPSEGIVRLLHAGNAGGAMLRRVLPAGLLVSLFLGFAVIHAQVHYHWEPGFSMALAGAGVVACLFTGIILTASDLERRDLAYGESERRFNLAARTAPVMIWLAGTDKLCTYVSEPWLAFTGRAMEAEVGNGWTESVHPDDLKPCVATYVQSFDRRETFQMQYRLRRHDGEYRWIFGTGVPRFDEDGSFAGYIGSCIDITERKLAEESLAYLERKVLSAQEDERARIARELHDDINQRIAFLCWELRTMDQRHDGEERRSRKSFDTKAEELSRIGDAVQAISHRLHSSHLDYLGLATAVEGLCKELRTQREVEIVLTCEQVPNNLPKDISLALYRVLQEALKNAMKHSGARQVNVELVADATELRLTVGDNGAGFTLQDTQKRQGLGLISMRERMRLIHGEFEVDSKPGRGTTISCKVPIGILDPSELSGGHSRTTQSSCHVERTVSAAKGEV